MAEMADKCDGVGERTWNRFSGVVKSVPSVDVIPVVQGHLIDGKEITLVNNGDYSHSIKMTLGDGWFEEEGERVTQ